MELDKMSALGREGGCVSGMILWKMPITHLQSSAEMHFIVLIEYPLEIRSSLLG